MTHTAILRDWKGEQLPVRFSRGASRVPYVEDWRRNVLGLGGTQLPPDWLMREVCGFTARESWFEPDDAAALAAALGRISKMQSLRSEDALTWSWFGTLALASPQERHHVLQWLYDLLGLNCIASVDAIVRQWERVPHPNALRNGPHIDAIVDDPGGTLIYVEAKWRADLGTGKGADPGVPDDQVVLRRDSMRIDPLLKNDARRFVVLVVAQSPAELIVYQEAETSVPPVTIAWTTWAQLAQCQIHPLAHEFKQYLTWKANVAA